MAIRINYNPMSVLTHQNLASADRRMEGILDRMSSGSKLRRSADDPASMVLANAVRYHRTGVERAQSNAEEAVTMLQTAEGGMDQITQVLQRMRTLAISALSVATQDPIQLQALQDELDAGVRSITTMATSTTFGRLPLLQGALRDNSLSEDARAVYTSVDFDYTKLPSGALDGSAISIDPASFLLSRTNTVDNYGPGTASTVFAFAGSGPVTINGPKGSVLLNLAPGLSIAGLVSAINSSTSATGVLAGYDETTGNLTVESTAYGSSLLSIDLTASTISGWAGSGVSTPPAASINATWTDSQGNLQAILLDQDPASPDGRTFTNTLGFPELAPPYSIYAPGAVSVVVKDTGAGGVGSTIAPASSTLSAKRVSTTALQIGALSNQRVTLSIPDLRAGALGTSAGLASSGFASLDALASSVGPPAVAGAIVAGNAAQALSLIDASLNEINRARGSVGALQGNQVERAMDSLRLSGDNLRGYESILRDVDLAAESAEYSRVQVMLQAAIAMLAQANQVPQTVLQLLK